MNHCYYCSGPVDLRREDRELHIGKRSAVVEHEFFYCSACKEEFIRPEQMERTQRRASAAIREKSSAA